MREADVIWREIHKVQKAYKDLVDLREYEVLTGNVTMQPNEFVREETRLDKLSTRLHGQVGINQLGGEMIGCRVCRNLFFSKTSDRGKSYFKNCKFHRGRVSA